MKVFVVVTETGSEDTILRW